MGQVGVALLGNVEIVGSIVTETSRRVHGLGSCNVLLFNGVQSFVPVAVFVGFLGGKGVIVLVWLGVAWGGIGVPFKLLDLRANVPVLVLDGLEYVQLVVLFLVQLGFLPFNVVQEMAFLVLYAQEIGMDSGHVRLPPDGIIFELLALSLLLKEDFLLSVALVLGRLVVTFESADLLAQIAAGVLLILQVGPQSISFHAQSSSSLGCLMLFILYLAFNVEGFAADLVELFGKGLLTFALERLVGTVFERLLGVNAKDGTRRTTGYEALSRLSRAAARLADQRWGCRRDRGRVWKGLDGADRNRAACGGLIGRDSSRSGSEEIGRVGRLGIDTYGFTGSSKVDRIDGDDPDNVKLLRTEIGDDNGGVCMGNMADDGAVDLYVVSVGRLAVVGRFPVEH